MHRDERRCLILAVLLAALLWLLALLKIATRRRDHARYPTALALLLAIVGVCQAATCADAVVRVQCGPRGGSGVVVRDGSSRCVLTCRHVVEESRVAVVTHADGSSYSLRVGAVCSRGADLAVLTGTIAATRPSVRVADREPATGEAVYAVGYPADWPAGRGVLCRRGAYRGSGGFVGLAVADIAVNGGDSGGGLFDSAGRLVGITSNKMTGGEGPGLCMAQPHAAVCRFLRAQCPGFG